MTAIDTRQDRFNEILMGLNFTEGNVTVMVQDFELVERKLLKVNS